MSKLIGAAVLAAGAVMAAGYGVAKTVTPTVNDSMTQVMAVEAQTIWDVSSKAFNDGGDGLDPRKLTAKDWKQLGEAGRRIKERAAILARAERITAAGPGEHILGEEAAHDGLKKTWDAASAKQIQALIDANPKLFAKHALTLQRAGENLEKASRTRDIRTVYRVSANLDEVCDGCHKPFWGTDDPPPPPKYVPVIRGR